MLFSKGNINHPDLKAFGYWREDKAKKSELPYPTDFIDNKLSQSLKEMLTNYICKKAKIIKEWKGYAKCRLCKERLGSACLSDGIFIFPEGYDHYIEEHNVYPPKEFIMKAIKFYMDHLYGD